MRIAGKLGRFVLLYIAARVIIVILAGFVPAQLVGVFTGAADFLIICAFIVAIASALLGGRFGFTRRVKNTFSSLAVFAILIMVSAAYFSGEHPAPGNPSPTPASPPRASATPIPTKPPAPAPTLEPAVTPIPSNPQVTAKPRPAPAPAPRKPQTDVFLMDEDNYSFGNNKGSFGYGADYSIPMKRFLQIFTPAMAETLYPLYSPWGGNCFGFASTSSLFNRGKLDPADYQSGANMAYSFGLPKNNRKLLEFIELYQISQSLSSVNSIERASQMNYEGLISAMYNADGSVNRRGVLIAVVKPTLGHAIIAYDIQNAGGGVYYLSIYDNNYPNDKNRKMRVDTKNRVWKYDSYGAGSHYFRYLDTSDIYSAVRTALANPTTSGEGGSMYIVAPADAEIFTGGLPISEAEGAFDATPLTGEAPESRMWYAPRKAAYDICIKGGGKDKRATFANDDLAIAVDVGGADASITGGLSGEGYVRFDTDGAFRVTLSRNEGKPVVVSGKSAEGFTLDIEGGGLLMTGDGKFTVRQGLRQATVKLERGGSALVDDTTLKSALPMYILAAALAIASALCFAAGRRRRW